MQETLTLSDGTSVQVADFELGFTLDSKAIAEPSEDGTIVIEGYASDFEVDRADEAFEPGAFQKALDDYMQNPVLLYHHKYDTALGAVREARLDQKGLWVRAEVPAPEPGTQTANYYRQIKDRVLRGFSVGGKFYRRMTQNGPRIFKADMREISITPMPVNPRTLFSLAGKAFEGMDTERDIDTSDIEAALGRIDAMLSQAEGKSSQHPDGPKVAALLYHMQQMHTLAEDTHQNATSDNVKSAAQDLSKHIEKHTAALHRVAAKIGPLPTYYGGSNF